MSNPSQDFNFEDFAKQMLEETKNMIRTMFSAFKDAAFPLAKQDTLDYQTVCMIEDEFRNNEKICHELLVKSFADYSKSNTGWLQRMDRYMSNYTNVALQLANWFIIATQGHHYTYYDIRPDRIPGSIVTAFFEEATREHFLLMLKMDKRKQAILHVAKKFSAQLKQDKTIFENAFSAAVRNIIEVEIPASQKRIEAIITQNYLQKVGAIHGMN